MKEFGLRNCSFQFSSDWKFLSAPPPFISASFQKNSFNIIHIKYIISGYTVSYISTNKKVIPIMLESVSVTDIALF